MKYIILTLTLALTVTAGFALQKDSKTTKTAPAATDEGGFAGKVVESMNAGGYTYVEVDTGAKKLWAAAPQFVVKKGDTVKVVEAMAMKNYHSKTLNRDFDVVYFTGNIAVNGQAPAAAPAGMAQMPKDHPPIGPAAKPIDLKGVKKADQTVGEVYASMAKLNGKQVKVRGKVVKYNPMIMDRNWIHIQDGTGAAGSNDLLVTSDQEVKVGDTVLVTGTVATNKDFGANYKYSVMIEKAKITVE